MWVNVTESGDWILTALARCREVTLLYRRWFFRLAEPICRCVFFRPAFAAASSGTINSGRTHE
jgi:hypothetical protein